MKEFLEYVKAHYENYVVGSEYLCDDGITFMFLTADDKLHTLYIDINEKCIKEA